MNLTPFAGTKSGTAPTFSRGYANTGKIHFTQAPTVKAGNVTKALCGANIVAYVVYNESATETLVDEHRRLAKTHVVYTCSRCVSRV